MTGPLWLTEEDVKGLLDMKTAVAAIGEAMRAFGEGNASNHPRRRHVFPGGTLQVLDAAYPAGGVMGLKSYSAMKTGVAEFHVTLYDAVSGKLIAFVEAEWMGRMRTGAATAVAAMCLARPGASALGLVGAGKQAATQLEALHAAGLVKRANVFARDKEKLIRFCEERSNALGIPVEPSSTLEAAVNEKDLVVTATPAKEPFLFAAMISPGCHVTAMGANHISRREVGADLFANAKIVAVDSVDGARLESGEIKAAVDEGVLEWKDVVELGALAAGKAAGRKAGDEITLFKSHGMGLWDVAAAARVVALAREKGIGRVLANAQ